MKVEDAENWNLYFYRFIEPSDELKEVCEGDSFMLQCPGNQRIFIGSDSDVQFGRNGDWEQKSRCGPGKFNL